MIKTSRQWTIYLAQDKHLDYGWCGSRAEIEVRMAALVDYYLDQAEQAGSRWNLDGTIWVDAYRRQRGEAGAQRLLGAIRDGRIGYAGNYAVLLWGLLSTELAIRACYGSLSIESATQVPGRTVLAMENPGLPWGVANVLTECGCAYLGRGIYSLRAESYAGGRDPYPLFWWIAPNGNRLLVRWDLYQDTRSWGGYAEAFALAGFAGEEWDAFNVRDAGDRNTAPVYQKRRQYIHETVQRYEAYGEDYSISSLLLLGTGWDNWTRTDDYAAFIRRFNAEPDGAVRLIDARYEDFFQAAAREIQERGLDIPTLEGSFGICWEEWAAHLAGPTAGFREAERLVRRAEAAYALTVLDGRADRREGAAIQQGYEALLRFAEHDFGGVDLARASISAGVRAGAEAEALSVGRALSPKPDGVPWPLLADPAPEGLDFSWREMRVRFDEERCAIASLTDRDGREWVPPGCGLTLGEFVRTLYRTDGGSQGVFPNVALASGCPKTRVDRVSCTRGRNGVGVRTDGARWGFEFATRWFLHADRPWIDVRYDLAGGWSEEAQSLQFCFPLAITQPIYRYDTGGAILVAGPKAEGGDDLRGANPSLYAVQTFAAAHRDGRGAILITPDAYLVQFGPDAVRVTGVDVARIPTQIVSMPMMNLTRNDWQFWQGGQRRWTFRYRLVLVRDAYDPLQPVDEAQHFGVPPYLQVPGEPAALAELARLEIDFASGPVLAFKVGEDGQRMILRLWNVLDRPVAGSVRLPKGYVRAERCDALERRQSDLDLAGDRVAFTVPVCGILTIAFCQA